MPLIFGIDTIALDPATTQGVVPVGTVLSIMSDIAGGFSIPASGVIEGGFMLCDGVAIPGGNPLNGNTPNMTNDIYLRGSTAAGSAAGANTKTLNTPQLPSHSHAASSENANTPHGHTAVGNTANAYHNTPAGGVPGNNAPHSHSIARSSSDNISALATNYRTLNTAAPAGGTGGANAPHGHAASPNGAVNAPHGHPVTVVANNAPHSHAVTVDATGSGDSFDIQPNYITCQYIIRVA